MTPLKNPSDSHGDAMLPPVLVTAGSRESIGAEILAKAWRHWAPQRRDKSGEAGPCFLSIGGDKKAFEACAVPCRHVSEIEEARAIFPSALPLWNEGLTARDSIDAALTLCRENKAGAIVTLPVEKEVFAEKRKDELVLWGHTEYLAAALGVEQYGMLIAWRGLRTLPISRHVALRDAVAMLDKASVLDAARFLHRALREDFAVEQPRLAIAGLNPHAGEGGLCGNEETTILQPAVKSLREQGMRVTGPHPPDSLFLPETRQTFDCALTLYHDQGLIPLKLLSNRRAVNITLGLPIVRCSPDHGTARDLVGRGIADAGSMIEALDVAWKMAKTRRDAKLEQKSKRARQED